MPRIIEYQEVLTRMAGLGMVCNYYNGGSFGFARGVDVKILGWIGPSDSTIRPEMLPLARHVQAPLEATVAKSAVRAWQKIVHGVAWIMPASHWAFELDFGSRAWLPAALNAGGIDASALLGQTNARAIEFESGEHLALQRLLESLLQNLVSSDFSLAFPDRPVICTVHHHKQLWWQTSDPDLIARLDAQTPLANSASAE